MNLKEASTIPMPEFTKTDGNKYLLDKFIRPINYIIYSEKEANVESTYELTQIDINFLENMDKHVSGKDFKKIVIFLEDEYHKENKTIQQLEDAHKLTYPNEKFPKEIIKVF